jgi:thiosulfate reductase cytochrome b subunit
MRICSYFLWTFACIFIFVLDTVFVSCYDVFVGKHRRTKLMEVTTMTGQQYRELRNHLQLQACYINVYTIEYKNLIKRISILTSKAYEADIRRIIQ